MGIFDEDISCVEKLLKPARRVLADDYLCHEMRERRIELWNEVKEKYDKYLSGECGKFLGDMDLHFQSIFSAALLKLAVCFRENGEDFMPAKRFSEKEVEAFKKIGRYNRFKIESTEDILRRIINRDERTLELLREYYLVMDSYIDDILDSPEDGPEKVAPPVKGYIKKTWDEYREKLNQAVSKAITELDWFRTLAAQWEKEAERLAAEKASERMAEAEAKVREALSEVERERQELEAQREELERRREEIEATLSRLREAEVQASRFVRREEARMMEQNFLGRLEEKLGDEVALGGRVYRVERKKEGRERDTSVFNLPEKERANLPENRYLEAELVEKKLLGRKARVKLLGVFASRVEELAGHGFDTQPLGLEEVNVYLVKYRDLARAENNKVVLCLASPTGFSKEVKDYVASEEFHRNFLSKHLSLCLLDCSTDRVLYNPSDEYSRDASKLFSLELDRERVRRVMSCVERIMEGKGYAVLEEAVERCNAEQGYVKAAFYALAEEKGYTVKYVSDVGLAVFR